MSAFLSVLSEIVGWVYFVLWTLSFYFLSYEFYKLKDVSGFSIDFLFLNTLGYICYSASCLYGFVNEQSPVGKTHLNDLVFALHGLLMCIIQSIQYRKYMIKGDKAQQISKKAIWNNCVILIILFIILLLQLTDCIDSQSKYMSLFVCMGYVKVYITLLKYTPQIYKNYVRKCTIGWNIYNTWCDFLGGLFSLLQIVIDCINSGNWNIFENNSTPLNIAKFSLGFITIIYDIVLFIQHYCLYTKRFEDFQNKDEYLVDAHNKLKEELDYEKDENKEDIINVEVADESTKNLRSYGKGDHQAS